MSDPQERRKDRATRGRDARAVASLASHADIGPAGARDPVGLLLGQAADRVPELVPIRHGRMLASPFAYYRGAALPMTADLAGTPASGLRVQLCGDAHLSNFGAFAAPDRRLVFDVNDFDETLPGPFEWDVKRLAASFAVTARDNGLPGKLQRAAAAAVAESYRTAMREFAGLSFMDVWYTRLDVEDLNAAARHNAKAEVRPIKRARTLTAKAYTHDSTQALERLTTIVDGRRDIVSDPPTVVPVEELYPDAGAVYDLVRDVLARYRRTLQSDRRHLLDQFTLQRVARKVVGVGSVGTRAWMILLTAGDGDEPLFLQAKEAQPAVLASYCGRDPHRNQGERVVAGQRLMQAASDIFLGWTRVPELGCRAGTDFYIRQLRDWKLSVPVDRMRPAGLALYARLCGRTLARAHARSGDRVAIAAYLGGSDRFDRAIAAFATAYADRNEHDFAGFQEAAARGRIEAVRGV